ncbi:ABC transporter permease [Suicoccus acidiformans]|uniref:ABC transporter permease n=1 Tax=Suicoccus acidiformans TaxID=2036206 RepID=A0A347WHR4_9LACT|nr:sugar ABC transporter permease [Suicoccus acidiformans]AXY24621.1 ABC transporter permease [Suicoccus acidiformans]
MKNNNVKTFLYLLPAIVIFGIFVFYPVAYTIYLSFFDWNMISPQKDFVGFENYINVFTDPETIQVLKNTLFYIIVLVLMNFVVPYIMAFCLHFLVPKFRDFFKSAFFLPSFISMVVGSIVYNWILNPTSGPIAKLLGFIGMSLPNWSVSESLVILVICYITAWKVFGYNFITLYADISGVDGEVIESARLDNVPTWRIFKDIVAPMTSSTGLYTLIMAIVTGLQYVYTPISNLTQGGPAGASSNLIYESYHNAFILFDIGTSAALSVVTLIIFVILLFIQMRVTERGVYYAN